MESVALGEAKGAARLDARIIARRARDLVHFEEDALALSKEAYRVARRMVRTRDGAEDLVQEMYLRAFRHWESFEQGTNLRAWLFRILTNIQIDAVRRQRRMPALGPLDEDRGPADLLEPDAEAQIESRLSQHQTVEALAALPTNFREAVILFDVGGFTGREVAAILGVPFGTVMSRVFRARRILRGRLAA